MDSPNAHPVVTPMPDSNDRATLAVEELLKTIVATAGIMLTLLWGLTQKTLSPPVLGTIQWASLLLVISIGLSILAYQFIVSHLQRNTANITGKGAVPFCFFVAWFALLVGCTLVVVAIFWL
jgi:hypothetical protein